MDPPYNPVLGAALAFLLTVVAFYQLILLIYTTVDQMRPVEVIQKIHDLTLDARGRQEPILRRTRRESEIDDADPTSIRSTENGFITSVDIDAIEEALASFDGQVEVVLRVPIGGFVAYQDEIAEIRSRGPFDRKALARSVLEAISLGRQRELDTDSAYGIEQLLVIGWTSISTAKSNPAPGLLTIRSLRDLLVRICGKEDRESRDDEKPDVVPLVYEDQFYSQLIDALESLALVSSESMQARTMTEILRTIQLTFPRMPGPVQDRFEDLLRRIVSCLGDHMLTAELESSLNRLIQMLETEGRNETAAILRQARETLGQSIGRLNNRSTRVPQSG